MFQKNRCIAIDDDRREPPGQPNASRRLHAVEVAQTYCLLPLILCAVSFGSQDDQGSDLDATLKRLDTLAEVSVPIDASPDKDTRRFIEAQRERLQLAHETQPQTDDVVTRRLLIDHQFESLRLLVQQEHPDAMRELWELAQSFRDDADDEVASTANQYIRIILLQQVLDGDRLLAPSLHEAVMAWIKEKPFTATKAEFAVQGARGLEKSERYLLAGSLYQQLANMLEKQPASDDLKELSNSVADARQRLSLIGQKIELSGETIDGSKLRSADFEDRMVLIDFWASWCQPCRREMPEIRRLRDRYGENGFAVISVCLDDAPDTAIEFLKTSKDVNWPSLYESDKAQRGFEHPLAKKFGVTLLPTAVLLDRNGRVISLSARGENLERWLVKTFDERKHRRSELRPGGFMMTRGKPSPLSIKRPSDSEGELP